VQASRISLVFISQRIFLATDNRGKRFDANHVGDPLYKKHTMLQFSPTPGKALQLQTRKLILRDQIFYGRQKFQNPRKTVGNPKTINPIPHRWHFSEREYDQKKKEAKFHQQAADDPLYPRQQQAQRPMVHWMEFLQGIRERLQKELHQFSLHWETQKLHPRAQLKVLLQLLQQDNLLRLKNPDPPFWQNDQKVAAKAFGIETPQRPRKHQKRWKHEIQALGF
jgi:hypothetical protein